MTDGQKFKTQQKFFFLLELRREETFQLVKVLAWLRRQTVKYDLSVTLYDPIRGKALQHLDLTFIVEDTASIHFFLL